MRCLAAAGEGFLAVVGGICLLPLCCLKLVYTLHVSPEDNTRVLTHNGLSFAFAMLAVAGVLLLVYPIFRRFSERTIFLLGLSLYLIVGIHWVLHASTWRGGDPAMILNYVQKILQDVDYSGLAPDHYLGFYPYQMGFLNYERLLWSLVPEIRFLFAVNLAWVLLIQLLLWRVSTALFPSRPMVRKYGILCSFCFLPPFLLMLFLYGTVPGTGSAILSWLFAILASVTAKAYRRRLYLCGTILAMAAAVWLKPDELIAAIALTICLVLMWLSDIRKRWDLLAAGCILIVCCFALQPVQAAYYRHKTGYPVEGIPMAAEIATGLQEHPASPYRAGRYNGYEYDIYELSGYDSTATASLARANIQERLAWFKAHPKEALDFFTRKLLATWCVPTFESVVTGPSEANGAVSSSPLMQSLYEGDWAFFFYERLMNGYVFLLYLLALIGCVRFLSGKSQDMTGRPGRAFILFPVICLTGGFLYHLVGETKALCAFMYVIMLLPFAAESAEALAGKLWRTLRR